MGLLVLAAGVVVLLVESQAQVPHASSSISHSRPYTMTDETMNLGTSVWESELYFQSLGKGSIIDLINGSSSCPCKVIDTMRIGNVFKAMATNNITLESDPDIGYQKITIGHGFVPNNYMPNVQPGDVFQHWTNASTIRLSNVQDPFFQNPNAVFVVYGKAILTRGGVQYEGAGTYQHVTSKAISDPHPTPGFTGQFGWIPTNGYFLLVVKSQYFGTDSDQSMIALNDGTVRTVSVTVSNITCAGLTYSFVDPLTGRSITVNYIIKFRVGTCAGGGEQAGPFTDSLGHSGYGWSLLFESG